MPSNSSEYQRKYYLANKEKILSQVKGNALNEIKCEHCDKMVKKSSMNAHKQTKLHKYIFENTKAKI
jgi:phage FluMu protein Com